MRLNELIYEDLLKYWPTSGQCSVTKYAPSSEHIPDLLSWGGGVWGME